MTLREYPEFARLWQEQVDPTESASLEALAKDIKRTAKRRRRLDFAVGAIAIGVLLLVMLFQRTELPIRLMLGFMIALLVWTFWKRQQIAEAARALPVGEPAAFFAAAIANARSELNFSTIGLVMAAPAGASLFVAALATRRGSDIGLALSELFGAHFVRTTLFLLTLAFGFVIFGRANVRLRQQLRRLEAMSRECEEEDMRDLTESE